VPLLNNLQAGLWRAAHVGVHFLSTARAVAHAHYGRQDNDGAWAWLGDAMRFLVTMSRAHILDALREFRIWTT
jgi:hypothetical protein